MSPDQEAYPETPEEISPEDKAAIREFAKFPYDECSMEDLQQLDDASPESLAQLAYFTWLYGNDKLTGYVGGVAVRRGLPELFELTQKGPEILKEDIERAGWDPAVVRELARTYSDKNAAMVLLQRIGLDSEELPQYSNSPLAFWQKVVLLYPDTDTQRAIRARAIRARARSEYPANRFF